MSHFSAKYRGLNSLQLADQAKVRNLAYTQLERDTGLSVFAGYKSSMVDISSGAREEEWDGVEFTSMGDGKTTYRIRISEEIYPSLYALRHEIAGLFSESERVSEAE